MTLKKRISLWVGVGVCAAGTLAAAAADSSPATTDASPPKVPLTRDGALASAMEHNRGVEVAEFGPLIAATLAPEARAAFDPVLLSTVSYGRDTRPDLSPATTSTSGLSSGGSGSGTSTAPVANAASLVSAISRLDRALDNANPADINTDNTAVSMQLSNRLPTGTELFLTGYTDLNEIHPGDDANVGDLSLGVRQPLLRGLGPKANLVALRQAKNSAAQSEETFRRALLGTARDVEVAYWDLVLAEEVVKIREVAVTLAGEQAKRTESFREVGKAIRGDVMSSQAEEATRRADLATAVGDLKNRNFDIVRLMNPDGAQDWNEQFAPRDHAEAVQVPTDGAESAKAALEHRPELKEAGFDVANLELDVVRERNGRLPQLDLVGSYGRYSAGHNAGDATRDWNSDRYDHYSVGLEFEMPLARRAEKARLQRAKFANARGEAAVRQLEEAVSAEARQAVVDVQQQWERLQATKVAVAGRDEELRIAQGRYEVGKVTNLDVLQVQRDLIQAQVVDAQARVGYLQSLTRLYAAEGTLLDRRGIAVEQIAEEK